MDDTGTDARHEVEAAGLLDAYPTRAAKSHGARKPGRAEAPAAACRSTMPDQPELGRRQAARGLSELVACARWEEAWGASNGVWVRWRFAAAYAVRTDG